MTKTVISVRLSKERLSQLDELCERLKMNRSQVIDSALRLLPELTSGKAELTYEPRSLQPKQTAMECTPFDRTPGGAA